VSEVEKIIPMDKIGYQPPYNGWWEIKKPQEA